MGSTCNKVDITAIISTPSVSYDLVRGSPKLSSLPHVSSCNSCCKKVSRVNGMERVEVRMRDGVPTYLPSGAKARCLSEAIKESVHTNK